jgi:hypothetical protein
MLFEKSPTYIFLSVCLIIIYVLFNIKENVMSLRTELLQINHQVEHEVDTIHLLKAELAYLTSPERLKSLNKQYVKLSETQLAQMEINPLNQKNKRNLYNIATARVNNKNIKWRYKKGISRYLTMVSPKK